jgi:hypothetical protein
MSLYYENLGRWIDFYAAKVRSKDSDAWRESEGRDAALREATVRQYFDKALAGNLTEEDRTLFKVLVCRKGIKWNEW